MLKRFNLIAHLLCATPFILLIWNALQQNLGANPVETLTDTTGIWGLRLLIISLAITPLRQFTKYNHLIRLRRPIGLWAFFYASLHLVIYVLFEHGLDFNGLLEDVIKRKFMTAGLITYILLVPLALTSTQKAIKRLGKNWRRLHYLVYPALAIAIIHLIWLTKSKHYSDIAPYIAISILLLAYRLFTKNLFNHQRKRTR